MDIEEINKITDEILVSVGNSNKISILFKIFIETESTKLKIQILNSLRKIFKYFIITTRILNFSKVDDLEIINNSNNDINEYENFLLKKLKSFLELIKQIINSDIKNTKYKRLCLKTFLEIGRYHIESLKISNNLEDSIIFESFYEIYKNSFEIKNKNQKKIFLEIIDEYCIEYSDFTELLLNLIENDLKKKNDKNLQCIFELLCKIPSIDSLNFENKFIQINTKKEKLLNLKRKHEEIDKDKKPFEQDKKNLKKKFSNCISKMIILLDENEEFLINTLKKLSKSFFANMENPIILSDFLTNKFDNSKNPDIKILAMKSLFILIIKYSFEYPNYYKKLYNLLKYDSYRSDSIWNSNFLAKFLKLLESSLRTSKISVLVLASFVKRLLRNTLFLPANISLWLIPFCINLIKKNSGLFKLIIKGNSNEREYDNFIDEETDIYSTKAIDSKLFELNSLSKHYLDDLKKFLVPFETKLENVDFFDLDDFKKIDYRDLIDLKLMKIKENFNSEIEIKNMKNEFENSHLIYEGL